jgi:hypothetical protein
VSRVTNTTEGQDKVDRASHVQESGVDWAWRTHHQEADLQCRSAWTVLSSPCSDVRSPASGYLTYLETVAVGVGDTSDDWFNIAPSDHNPRRIIAECGLCDPFLRVLMRSRPYEACFLNARLDRGCSQRRLEPLSHRLATGTPVCLRISSLEKRMPNVYIRCVDRSLLHECPGLVGAPITPNRHSRASNAVTGLEQAIDCSCITLSEKSPAVLQQAMDEALVRWQAVWTCQSRKPMVSQRRLADSNSANRW